MKTNRAIPPANQDSIIPIRRQDVVRDDLERKFRRAVSEWEWLYALSNSQPEIRRDPQWQGIESLLANRADNAWSDWEDYMEGVEP